MAGAPSVSEIFNYLRIDDALATSGQPTEEELAAAADEGVEVVINLALHDDPRYSLADEAGTVRALGMSYIHIPVRFDDPRVEELHAFFDALARHRKHKVLVHCAANKRVTAFLGLYRVIREGWDTDAAFAPMKSIWEPNPIWASFIRSALAQHRET